MCSCRSADGPNGADAETLQQLPGVDGEVASVFVPIDPNGADAETLQQLPGVDGEVAAALIEARPYGDAAAFLDKLASLIELDEDDVPDLSAMLTEADEA